MNEKDEGGEKMFMKCYMRREPTKRGYKERMSVLWKSF